jgi:ubiquinone/menaquinone biosynthesis C-methylase UbiE
MNESKKFECLKAEASYLSIASCIHRLTDPAIRSAVNALGLPPGSKGLDAGCGIGDYTLWLAEAVYPNGHVTGIDISQENLSCAKAMATASKTKIAERVMYQHGDLNDLPFEDDSFDWAWCADVLWPVPDQPGLPAKNPLSILKELVRVVKPGGIIALLFWSSQRLLPGYPLLESRLSATYAANFPYHDTTRPDLHILRALGWLHQAGLEKTVVRTFAADVQAPLDDSMREALTASFQMLWGKAKPELSEKDWAELQRLCQPESADFILNLPDYYAFVTHSLFSGRVPLRP